MPIKQENKEATAQYLSDKELSLFLCEAYQCNSLIFQKALFILALSCSFRLLFTLYAGLFIVFSLAELCEHTGTSALLFEATKSIIKRFAFSELDFSHFISLPSLTSKSTKLLYTNSGQMSIDFSNFLAFFFCFLHRFGQDFYFTTMFTILFGTAISFTIVLPLMAAEILSSALASAIASSFGQLRGRTTVARSLPLI